MMLLATSSGGILAPIVNLFGYIMEYIYIGLSNIGIFNLGICIIIFTFISKLIIFPLTLKQQRSMKINQVAQPEINKIQKKYRNRKDQASMMKQQEEMNAVYAKYGTSPTGGCLTTFIQFPIIMSLYYVVRNLEAYIPNISKGAYDFILGININNAPGWHPSFAWIIPIASVVFQYLSMKTSMSNSNMDDNPAAGMTKSMMLTMPLMSLFMCVTLPAALGIYWATSAAFQFLQQVLIDTYYDHADMDKIIEKSREKAAKKKAKKGPSMYEKMMTGATGQQPETANNTSTISSAAKAKSTKNIDYSNRTATGGIAAKANSVKKSDKGGK